MRKVIIRENGCIDGLDAFLRGPYSTTLLYTDEPITGLEEFPSEYLEKPRTIFEDNVSIDFIGSEYIKKYPGGKFYILEKGFA